MYTPSTQYGYRMYVKWEDCRRYGTAAVLLKACRFNGKPSQLQLVDLGTYPGALRLIKKDEHNVHKRAWFWHEATQRLAGLDLSAQQREQVEASIAKRLPRPTQDEITAYDQARRAVGFSLGWPPGTRGVGRRRRKLAAIRAAAMSVR